MGESGVGDCRRGKVFPLMKIPKKTPSTRSKAKLNNNHIHDSLQKGGVGIRSPIRYLGAIQPPPMSYPEQGFRNSSKVQLLETSISLFILRHNLCLPASSLPMPPPRI